MRKNELLRQEFDSFYSDLDCPSCGTDLHPEDGYLEYFNQLSGVVDEMLGRPFMIGGFATAGARHVEIGKTREDSLIGVVDTIKIDIARVFDPPTEEEALIEDLDGEEIEVFWNKLRLLDKAVVAYIEPVDDGSRLGIVTSERDSTDEEEVNVGYHVTYHIPEVESPPWTQLLREVAENYYRGKGLSARPLLISAYENHLSTQLARTLRVKGWPDEKIDEFFERHYSWKQRSKDGLEEAAGVRLPDYDFDVYDDYAQIKDERDNYLVHIDHDADIAEVPNKQAKEDFKCTIKAILSVYEICYQERESHSQ